MPGAISILEVRVPSGADEVLGLAAGVPHPEEAFQIADPGLKQEGQEALEQLGGEVGVPKGRVALGHGDVEAAGQLEEAQPRERR